MCWVEPVKCNFSGMLGSANDIKMVRTTTTLPKRQTYAFFPLSQTSLNEDDLLIRYANAD
jgi:hypothetical protein